MQINGIALERPVLLTFLIISLAGCGGTKILKAPEPLTVTQSLADVSDESLSATLDWVIVRGGPGTWAKNADWDEYFIRVRNVGGNPLQITDIRLMDSLGTQIAPGSDRRQLVKGSKQAKRRYQGDGLTVQAGAGAGTLMVAGAATAVTAVGVGTAAAFGSTAMAGAAVGGLVLAPALAVGGIVRGVNNSKVNNRIETRLTPLPVVLETGDEIMLDVFFPLTPSPRQVELTYVDSLGEHIIIVDTRSALDGLHLAKDAE
jgi:hypothetical protein